MRTGLVNVIGHTRRDSDTTTDPEHELIITLSRRNYRHRSKSEKSCKK